MIETSYRRKLKVRRFRYDDDRDALSRGIGEIREYLQWLFWLGIAIAGMLLLLVMFATVYWLFYLV